MSKCLNCGKSLTGRQIKFCGRTCKNTHNNHNHQCYQNQIKRGIERKLKLINSKGGSCSKCGYKKNIASLVFHHEESDEKEKQLSMRECSNNSMQTLLEEVEKCILLCHNCHMETHYPHLDGLLDT